MSRGYSATPLWVLNRNSAVAGKFVVKIYRLLIVRISALRDPMREIQRFLKLGHYLCENDKQTLHDNGRVFTTPDVSLNIPEGVLFTD